MENSIPPPQETTSTPNCYCSRMELFLRPPPSPTSLLLDRGIGPRRPSSFIAFVMEKRKRYMPMCYHCASIFEPAKDSLPPGVPPFKEAIEELWMELKIQKRRLTSIIKHSLTDITFLLGANKDDLASMMAEQLHKDISLYSAYALVYSSSLDVYKFFLGIEDEETKRQNSPLNVCGAIANLLFAGSRIRGLSKLKALSDIFNSNLRNRTFEFSPLVLHSRLKGSHYVDDRMVTYSYYSEFSITIGRGGVLKLLRQCHEIGKEDPELGVKLQEEAEWFLNHQMYDEGSDSEKLEECTTPTKRCIHFGVCVYYWEMCCHEIIAMDDELLVEASQEEDSEQYFWVPEQQAEEVLDCHLSDEETDSDLSL